MRRTSLMMAAALSLSGVGAAHAATDVIDPTDVFPVGANPTGWEYTAPNPSPTPNGPSSATFEFGPAPAPAGVGSLHMDYNDPTFVGIDSGNLYQGNRMSDLESVSFSYRRSSADATSTEEPVVVLRIDEDGDFSTPITVNGRVWLQPRVINGVPAADTWFNVTFDRTAAVWEVTGLGTISLDTLFATYPNAELVGTARPENSYQATFRIAPGSGFHADVYFDNLSFVWDNDQNPEVDTNLVTDTYDFEPFPIPEPASLALAAGGALTLLRRKRA